MIPRSWSLYIDESGAGRPSLVAEFAGRLRDDDFALSAAELLKTVFGITLTRPATPTEGK
jgi:hypothetical protein